MKFRVTSKHGGIVDGLGVFEPGETRELSDYEVWFYTNQSGIALESDSLPEGFEVDSFEEKMSEEEAVPVDEVN